MADFWDYSMRFPLCEVVTRVWSSIESKCILVRVVCSEWVPGPPLVICFNFMCTSLHTSSPTPIIRSTTTQKLFWVLKDLLTPHSLPHKSQFCWDGMLMAVTLLLSYIVLTFVLVIPSVHLLPILLHSWSQRLETGGAGAYPRWHWPKAEFNPRWDASSSFTTTRAQNHTYRQLKVLICLICTFLDFGKKSE